jgi:hypothetical protein
MPIAANKRVGKGDAETHHRNKPRNWFRKLSDIYGLTYRRAAGRAAGNSKAHEFYALRAERDVESDLVAAAFIYISMGDRSNLHLFLGLPPRHILHAQEHVVANVI